MTDDMGFDLKLPAVGELTFPQWQDWLARYNAVLAERDNRIEKLEAALNCNLPDYDPKIGIVERLRQLGNWRVDGTKSSPIYNKSADHIEKLEAALREIIQEDALTGKTVFVGDFGKIAIAALREKE